MSIGYYVKTINPNTTKIEQRDAMFVHSHLARHCCQLIETTNEAQIDLGPPH